MRRNTEFEVYLRASDRALRVATSVGAGLPGHLKRKEWVLLPRGNSLVHTDAARDIAVQGFCLFRVVDGKSDDKRMG
jgi:hypothetical protein